MTLQSRKFGLAVSGVASLLTLVYVALWVGIPAEEVEWIGLYIWPLTPYAFLIGFLSLKKPPKLIAHKVSILSTEICAVIAIVGHFWYLYGALSTPLYDTFIIRMGVAIVPLGQWIIIILVPLIAFLQRRSRTG